jgi:acyl dehydratase
VSPGAITEEAVTALRGWLGVERRERGWNSVVSEDAIWHFAQGVGDDNPLWWDRGYAEGTRWGRMFAPPTFLYSCSSAGLRVGESGIFPAQDWMPGTLPLWISDRWVWRRPAWMGEQVVATTDLVGVEERPARDGTRSVTHTDRTSYRGPDGDVIAERYTLMVRRERPSSPGGADGDPAATPAPAVPEAVYSDEDRAEIGAQYDREPGARRGSATRTGDDVAVGDRLTTLVKGPLTVTNIVGWMLGWGSPLCQTNRIAHQYLQQHPRSALHDPRSNVDDSIEGVHWDPFLAQMSGLARCYDFGAQRISWVAHLLTDWCGDDGFLAELEVRVRRPNFVGDTTWLTGAVTGVTAEGERTVVDCAVTGTNQRGEETTAGTAKVVLPSQPS